MLNNTFGSKSSAGTNSQNLIDSVMGFFYIEIYINT
jgi:hypothetical protein